MQQLAAQPQPHLVAAAQQQHHPHHPHHHHQGEGHPHDTEERHHHPSPAASSQASGAASDKPPSPAFGYPDRFQMYVYEREQRWGEVRRYSEMIRRYSQEAAREDITKDKYIEMYNLAVSLLRAVDSLDPDKRGKEQMFYAVQPTSTQPMSGVINFGPTNDGVDNSRNKGFEQHYRIGGFEPQQGLFNLSGTAKFSSDASTLPLFYTSAGQKNMSGEVFFDDATDGDGSSKPVRRRRKRTVYSTRRNLRCHMCGTTETPEWRRGPDGDHTLCNACGLHYAKSIKKDKKPKEKRHSIEMLLNVEQQQQQPQGAPPPQQQQPPPQAPQDAQEGHNHEAHEAHEAHAPHPQHDPHHQGQHAPHPPLPHDPHTHDHDPPHDAHHHEVPPEVHHAQADPVQHHSPPPPPQEPQHTHSPHELPHDHHASTLAPEEADHAQHAPSGEDTVGVVKVECGLDGA
eukprot:CAMPEP_0177652800 /NCGR_PEP_ID=MMETSP0447-20121125/13342_1 /TAXON_ID=0 /ORGANISM="Stygamoeba regulata, Strain BSH-02190019" /LENGTH=454 /DNA_ID=CAMNT_0019156107 /DNA_START=82 /DNA_END=1446 /DNA_ORIENTATION=+